MSKKITKRGRYMMKVLMLNGSPRTKGNTFIALEEMKKVFEVEGVEAEIVQVGNKDVRGCIACRRCVELGKCVFDDVVNELAPKFEEADGIVVASPVYFASANATLIATLDRLFFSTSFDKTMKVGASVVCARRGGCSATFDELNKYFTISNMPIAASQYWNCIHGRELREADRDEEGKQTMRVLARNMTDLVLFLVFDLILLKAVWTSGKGRTCIHTFYQIEIPECFLNESSYLLHLRRAISSGWNRGKG